jgi:tRNA threonylcarbamoyladenosine biosynthesis protein TsaE
VDLRSLDDTRALAARLVDSTGPGGLLLLSGPLGAGKTTLTRFLAEALGSEARVSSPTYTLVHEYPTPHGLLVHMDAYRLEGAAALEQLGLDDYLDRSRLTVVEWGEALADSHPEAWLVRLERDGDVRRATVRAPRHEAGA